EGTGERRGLSIHSSFYGSQAAGCVTDNTAEMPGISFSTLRFSKHTNGVHPQSETDKPRTVSQERN
ncbi:MAG TPA: hypothetical protein VGO42_25170, partial [Reyranella sp.]|nr:hypothetical protein [Reyranella sp.]